MPDKNQSPIEEVNDQSLDFGKLLRTFLIVLPIIVVVVIVILTLLQPSMGMVYQNTIIDL